MHSRSELYKRYLPRNLCLAFGVMAEEPFNDFAFLVGTVGLTVTVHGRVTRLCIMAHLLSVGCSAA